MKWRCCIKNPSRWLRESEKKEPSAHGIEPALDKNVDAAKPRAYGNQIFPNPPKHLNAHG